MAIYLILRKSGVRTGKYTFVVGDREIRVGDPNSTSKLKNYWVLIQSQLE